MNVRIRIHLFLIYILDILGFMLTVVLEKLLSVPPFHGRRRRGAGLEPPATTIGSWFISRRRCTNPSVRPLIGNKRHTPQCSDFQTKSPLLFTEGCLVGPDWRALRLPCPKPDLKPRFIERSRKPLGCDPLPLPDIRLPRGKQEANLLIRTVGNYMAKLPVLNQTARILFTTTVNFT